MDRTDVEEISTHLGRLSKLTGGACLFMALRGADRTREPELWIGISECFPGIRFDEGLLVGDELVQDVIGDLGLSCLNAIAHPPHAGVVIAILEDTR